jgi:hypothetical protein
LGRRQKRLSVPHSTERETTTAHGGEKQRKEIERRPNEKRKTKREKEDALITSVDSIQIYKRASYYCHTAGFN